MTTPAATSVRTTSALDYGWWASDGPTAGYLVRRAIDALEQSPDAVGHALLANHLSATAEGYCFELSEVWSDRGELLATAELIRAIHDHHSAP
jgi:hypothetical protein